MSMMCIALHCCTHAAQSGPGKEKKTTLEEAKKAKEQQQTPKKKIKKNNQSMKQKRKKKKKRNKQRNNGIYSLSNAGFILVSGNRASLNSITISVRDKNAGSSRAKRDMCPGYHDGAGGSGGGSIRFFNRSAFLRLFFFFVLLPFRLFVFCFFKK